MGFIKTDKFGNKELIFSLVEKKTKDGEILDGVYIGVFKLRNKEYIVETSNSNKESKDGRSRRWGKVREKRNGNNYNKKNDSL